MAKVAFYKMTHDNGFAPNPFWGYLTLATCTPNHMRANIQKGDWIVGVEAKGLAEQRKKSGWKGEIEQSLIYIAKIDEVMNLTDYFKDERFQEKKFQKSGDWKKRRGDNVYYKENGIWKWLRGHDHEPDELKDVPNEELFFSEERFDELIRSKEGDAYGHILQDIYGNRVFVSKEFSYFGDMCVALPQELKQYVPEGRGIKYTDFEKVADLLENLMQKYGKGELGRPIGCHIYDFCEEQRKASSCGS